MGTAKLIFVSGRAGARLRAGVAKPGNGIDLRVNRLRG